MLTVAFVTSLTCITVKHIINELHAIPQCIENKRLTPRSTAASKLNQTLDHVANRNFETKFHITVIVEKSNN